MIRSAYKTLLRGPRFKGRARLEAGLRALLAPPADEVAGLRMELDALEWAQADLLAGRPAEPATLKLFEALLRAGDSYLDVGAHVGFHALVAARLVGETGRVIAIDPQPYNCDRLLTNVQLNGFRNMLVVCAAAGDRDGAVILQSQARSDKSRLSLCGDGVNDEIGAFETALVRLDTLTTRHGLSAVRLIKIDVEGYEPWVVDGASRLLNSTDHLVLELLPGAQSEPLGAMLSKLEGLSFRFFDVEGKPWARGGALIENNLWATRAPA